MLLEQTEYKLITGPPLLILCGYRNGPTLKLDLKLDTVEKTVKKMTEKYIQRHHHPFNIEVIQKPVGQEDITWKTELGVLKKSLQKGKEKK